MIPNLEKNFCINRQWERNKKKWVCKNRLDIDLHVCVFIVKNVVSTIRLVFT